MLFAAMSMASQMSVKIYAIDLYWRAHNTIGESLHPYNIRIPQPYIHRQKQFKKSREYADFP